MHFSSSTAPPPVEIDRHISASESNTVSSLLTALVEDGDDSRKLAFVCTPTKCLNGGSCVTGSTKCTCTAAWLGSTCSKAWCTSTICLNGGSCNIGDSACTCAKNFYGRTCATARVKCPKNQYITALSIEYNAATQYVSSMTCSGSTSTISVSGFGAHVQDTDPKAYPSNTGGYCSYAVGILDLLPSTKANSGLKLIGCDNVPSDTYGSPAKNVITSAPCLSGQKIVGMSASTTSWTYNGVYYPALMSQFAMTCGDVITSSPTPVPTSTPAPTDNTLYCTHDNKCSGTYTSVTAVCKPLDTSVKSSSISSASAGDVPSTCSAATFIDSTVTCDRWACLNFHSQASTVSCDHYSSCLGGDFNGGMIYCNSYVACNYAHFYNYATVKCAVSGACGSVTSDGTVTFL